MRLEFPDPDKPAFGPDAPLAVLLLPLTDPDRLRRYSPAIYSPEWSEGFAAGVEFVRNLLPQETRK